MRRASVFIGALAMVGALVGCNRDEGLSVNRIEPRTGIHEGGELITVHGRGFQETGVTIYFGEREVRPQSVTDRQMSVVTPRGPRDEAVDVEFVFDDGRTIKFEDAFTYTDRAAGFGVDELVTGESEKEE